MDFPEIIKKNDIKELEDFLKNNDVNEEVHGQSLLFWAVHLGNLEFAKVLIKRVLV